MMLSVMWLLPSVAMCAEEVKGQSEVAQPPSAVLGDSAQPGAAVLQAVAKMATAQQQAWLGRLEQRAGRAARLTLGPKEAAKQQARTAARLHQKLVIWQALRELIEETDRRERDAIDVLVRRYRSRVIETFHKQLDVRDERQAAWADVYRDWKAAGGQFEQQDRLIDWLEAAIGSADPEHVGAIPERPRFENGRPPANVARRPVESVKVQRSEKREEGAKVRTGEKVKTGEKVEVNVEELAARIAGSNLGFRTLESDLDEKGTWDAARLEPLAERLRILVLRHADLSLFRSLAAADQRSSVGRLESPQTAISDLGARISEARKLASGEEFKGTQSERRAELDRLEALSRRLAEVGGD